MERFDDIVNILKNSKNALAVECLNKIRTEEIHFQPGFIRGKKELESLYEFRLRTAEDLNRDKFKEEELGNWNIAINELKATNFDQLLLCSINTESKLYMLFVNADIQELGAIFFLYQKQYLENLERHSKEIKENGYSSSSLKFNRGKLIDGMDNVS